MRHRLAAAGSALRRVTTTPAILRAVLAWMLGWAAEWAWLVAAWRLANRSARSPCSATFPAPPR